MTRRLRLCAGALAVALLVASNACSPGSDAGAPELRFQDDPASAAFGRVLLGPWAEEGDAAAIDEGLAAAGAQLERAFAIWKGAIEPAAGGCEGAARQPLLGRYRFRAGFLEFEPRFPWSAGSTYTVCADTAVLGRFVPELASAEQGREPLGLTFTVPMGVGEAPSPPAVERVWPSSASVPANLLRFYVHFDRPMRQREVAARVSLVAEDGEALVDGFVPIPEGLWDPRSQRLTLFVHPGRIKRGVGPHERLGAVLEAGTTLRLRIDRSIESAEGVPMVADFEQSYRVTAADRTAPDPARWRAEPPTVEEAPVTIYFDEPLDHEQLLSFARIIEDGEKAERERVVPGTATPGPDGRSWSFTPAQGWDEQSYLMVARRDIEDLAGNRPGRLFDVDTRDRPGVDPAEPVAVAADDEPLVFPFEVVFEH